MPKTPPDRSALELANTTDDVAEATLDVNSATLRTFKLALLRPSELVRSRLEGERKYVGPARLFVLLTGISVVLMYWLDPETADWSTGWGEEGWLIYDAYLPEGVNRGQFRKEVVRNSEKLVVGLEVLAVVLLWPFVKLFDRKRPWLQHLTILLYYASTAVLWDLPLLPVTSGLGAIVSLVVHLAVVYTMFRTWYPAPWYRTAIRVIGTQTFAYLTIFLTMWPLAVMSANLTMRSINNAALEDCTRTCDELEDKDARTTCERTCTDRHRKHREKAARTREELID